MFSLLADPWFYAAALPAVILVGLSKGGFGGATALLGVPLMALVMPPVQAAAIMLPVLIVMDIATLWNWRGYRDTKLLFSMLPGGLIGIGIGWMTAAVVTNGMVRLIVGLVALLFALRYVQARITRTDRISKPNGIRATFWASVAGFTSFVAHAGGPPYQIYTLSLRLDPKVYTGTSVLFFCRRQCGQAGAVFLPRTVRRDKYCRIVRTVSVCGNRHFYRRLDRAPDETGTVLSVHVRHGLCCRAEVDLGRGF